MPTSNRYGAVSVGADIPPQYRFHLHRDKSDTFSTVDIYGYLPEAIEFGLEANYDTPLGSMASAVVPDNIGTKVYSMFGGTFTNRLLTTKFWAGTATGVQTISFDLVAERDPVKEIREPLQALYSLVLPIEKVDGGLFMSPGPSFSIKKFRALGKEKAQELENLVTGSAKSAVASTPQALSNAKETAVNGATTVATVAGKALDSVTKGIQGALGKNPVGGVAGYTQNSQTTPASGGTAKVVADSKTAASPGFVDRTLDKVQETQGAVDQGIASVSNAIESCIEGRISISLGQHMMFRNVVILGVSHSDPVRPNKEGYMLKSTVTIKFEPMQSLTNRSISSLLPIYGPSQKSTDTAKG